MKNILELFSESSGSNSIIYFLLDKNKKKMSVVKFTNSLEDDFMLPCFPKLLSFNSLNFLEKRKELDFQYSFEYQYIDGFLLDNSCIDDKSFLKLLSMASEIFMAGLFVRDSFLKNVIIADKKAYYVDLGGIESADKSHQVFPFDLEERSEEVDNYEECYGTESFIIYRLADNLIHHTQLEISIHSAVILRKMHSYLKADRFHSFKEIVVEFNR